MLNCNHCVHAHSFDALYTGRDFCPVTVHENKKYLPFLITYLPIYSTLASACLSFVPEASPGSSLTLHAKMIKSIA